MPRQSPRTIAASTFLAALGLLPSRMMFAAAIAGSSPPPLATPAASPPVELPDIRPILPPEQYYIAPDLLPLVVALVCLLLAGVVAWYLLRRPKKIATGPVLGPREIARQRLAEIAASLDTLGSREFGAEVCDVMRTYISSEYRMNSQRQTSPEFLAAISDSRVFSRSEHALLGHFLEGCDLLKFARLDATTESKRALLRQATEFINGRETEPAPLTTGPGTPPAPRLENEGAAFTAPQPS